MHRRRRIKARVKAEVMEKLKEARCSVAEISTAYEISKATLHKWKQQLKTAQLASDVASGRFVELSVGGAKRKLTKASLVFDDIAISVEGRMSMSDLASIARLLEG